MQTCARIGRLAARNPLPGTVTALVFGLFTRSRSSPRRDQLRRLSLFVDLTDQELAIVECLLHDRHYCADEVIFDEGEVGRAIYIVVAGEVTICRQGAPETGRLARLGAGEFFGELALLDDSTRSAQARAATPCTLAVFFRDDFTDLMSNHVGIAYKIGWQLLRHLGRRLRETSLLVGVDRHL